MGAVAGGIFFLSSTRMHGFFPFFLFSFFFFECGHLFSPVSDGKPEDGDDAIHGLVFPSHGARAVCGVVPITRTGRV